MKKRLIKKLTKLKENSLFKKIKKQPKKVLIGVAVLVVIVVGIFTTVNIQKPSDYFTGKNLEATIKASEKKKNNEKKNDEKKNDNKEKNSENKKESVSSKKSSSSKNSKSTTPSSSSKSSKSTTPSRSNNNNNITVYVTLDMHTIKPGSAGYNKLKSGLRKIVPSNGYVLYNNKVTLKKNSTAWDALNKSSQQYGFPVSHQGSGNSLYVNGIDNIFEFDAGNGSGWMYAVNNIFPNYGMDAYILTNNSSIRYAYTVNLGCDLNASGATGVGC